MADNATPVAPEVKPVTSQNTSEAKSVNDASKVKVPSIQDLFKAGVQFGHETRRWDPKMKKFIYSSKEGIHIIDIAKTQEKLKKAVEFLVSASERGPVIFVGTKKQATEIVKETAIRSGAHFVNIRWAGGVLTNFKEVKKSLMKLVNHEKQFEEGVVGRTKYEVSLMKKEWAKLSRLYAGVKTLNEKPSAVVVVDAKYERSAIRECRSLHIPVVALVDTNTAPDDIDYVIPGNDDALGSIQIIMDTLADAVFEGNKAKRVVHNLRDYSKVEVVIIKKTAEELEEIKANAIQAEKAADNAATQKSQPKKFISAKNRPAASKSGSASKGILEKVQESKKVTPKATAK